MTLLVDSVYSLLWSRNPAKYWFRVVCLLGTLILALWAGQLWINPKNGAQRKEGFSQNDDFVLKRNFDVFDSFYAQIYDRLYATDTWAKRYAECLAKNTNIHQDSVILDAGCGTGSLARVFHDQGYHVVGVDRSSAMLDVAKSRSPDIPWKCAELKDMMIFTGGTFTHIFLTGMTLYSWTEGERAVIFRNFAYWLKPGGVVAVQMVDGSKFDVVIPAANPSWLSNPLQAYADERITETVIDFIDFTYKGALVRENTAVLWRESFIDAASKQVRQNEIEWKFENDDDKYIDSMTYSGLTQWGRVSLDSVGGDPHAAFVFLKSGAAGASP